MSPQKPCLYCPAPDSSREHVFSEALGCREHIKQGTCRTCNSKFGHSFEARFIDSLALFLNFFKIPNGDGVVPSVRMKGKIGSENCDFILTGDGRAELHPRVLADRRTTVRYEKKFGIFHKAQEQKIEEQLRSKHPDLSWSRLREKQVKASINAQPDFKFGTLCSAEANRTVAKYAVNLLIREYGYDWIKGKVGDLTAYVKGQPSSTRVGIFWDPDLLRRFPLAPPKHLFVTVCSSKNHTVAVFLHLFCLLPFCVLTEDAGIVVDSASTGALDPANGRFAPLFLGGSPAILKLSGLPHFPMPEFEFSDRLRHIEIGTIRQAKLAAVNALTFLKTASSAESGAPHICYNCRKILSGLTPICPYCGNSPLPEEAA